MIERRPEASSATRSTRRRVLLMSACLVAIVTWSIDRPSSAHTGEQIGGGNPGLQGSALFDAPCVNGMAGDTYPCSNVDLLAYLPRSSIGGGNNTSDLWGWTDPQSGREYALVGRSNGTAFVDVSDPIHPLYLGDLPTETVESSWRDVKTYQNYAFIVSEAQFHGMQVFDLTQLRTVTNPPVTFADSAHYPGFSNSHNLVIDTDTGFAYAVGTNTCAGGLHMIDVRDPLHPTYAGCFSSDGYTHDAQCVIYAGPDNRYTGHEVCFACNEDTLTIADVTNKSAPTMLSRTSYTGWGYVHQGWLTTDQSYFLQDDEQDELNSNHNTYSYVWDVANLRAPVMIGHYTATTPAIDHNQYIVDLPSGEYTFQANYRAGLRVLRLDDVTQAALHEVGYFDVFPADDAAGFNGAWGNYPFFASGNVIVSGIEQGLFVLRPHLDAAPAATPTPTATASSTYDVSGHVRYHGSGLAVSGAAVYLQGPTPGMVQTDSSGQFLLGDLDGGTWGVRPQKTGDVGNAVSAADAVFALQAAVHMFTPDAALQMACDVSGDGRISPTDALLILRYKVGLITAFPVTSACASDWAFMPEPAPATNQQVATPAVAANSCQPGGIDWTPLSGSAADQDFSAVLFGDCSGNWTPSTGSSVPGRPENGSGRGSVRVGAALRTTRSSTLRVPVYVQAAAPFHSIDLQLSYDATRLRWLRMRGVRQARGALAAVNQRVPGLIAISLASLDPLRSGAVLVLEFRGRAGVVGAPVHVASALVGEQ
jgi:choice-of-anchor B domain-containing protein